MSGFIIECLFATGWRRGGEIFWLFDDAKREADRKLKGPARATRILPVQIDSQAVYSSNCDVVGA